MENKYNINIGLIDSIDRQIEELQRKKEALQMGYCYIPGSKIIDEPRDFTYVYTTHKEENK